jgi:hypothetical protein
MYLTTSLSDIHGLLEIVINLSDFPICEALLVLVA